MSALNAGEDSVKYVCVARAQTKSKMSSPMDKNFFKYNGSVARSTFSNSREVVGRHKVSPGHYIVVASTFRPNEEGDFLLRIFSEQKAPAVYVNSSHG